MSQPHSTREDFSQIRILILDMDGVLWREDEPIGDLPLIFDRIRSLGCDVVLATNNSLKTPNQFIEKLAKFGVWLDESQIVTSSQAAAFYMQKRFPDGGPVYIIGETGLAQAMIESGFYHDDKNVLAVISGLDRKLTYEQLKRATLLIRSGAEYVATNQDRTLPTPEGQVPGAGTIIAALEAATGVKPYIAGKPAPEMYRFALEKRKISPDQALIVGDRLETDIAGAQTLGCKSALVLTGVSSREQGLAWSPPPDIIARDLSAVLDIIEKQR